MYWRLFSSATMTDSSFISRDETWFTPQIQMTKSIKDCVLPKQDLASPWIATLSSNWWTLIKFLREVRSLSIKRWPYARFYRVTKEESSKTVNWESFKVYSRRNLPISKKKRKSKKHWTSRRKSWKMTLMQSRIVLWQKLGLWAK